MGVHVSIAIYDGKTLAHELRDWDCVRHTGDADFFSRVVSHGMCDVMHIDETKVVYRPNDFPICGTRSRLLQWANENIGCNHERWEFALDLFEKNPDAWFEISY